MAKRKVTTIVTLEVKLEVPYKKTPGFVMQQVSHILTEHPDIGLPTVQLIKKETTYA